MRINDVGMLPPGLMNTALFFGTVVFGAAYIVIAKLFGFSAFAVTLVPVSITSLSRAGNAGM
jgi:hypothetical protein